MNVWIVYKDTGAYSSWNRVVVAVFSTREAADEYAARMTRLHPVPRDDWDGPWWESSGDEFWVVDAVSVDDLEQGATSERNVHMLGWLVRTEDYEPQGLRCGECHILLPPGSRARNRDLGLASDGLEVKMVVCAACGGHQ